MVTDKERSAFIQAYCEVKKADWPFLDKNVDTYAVMMDGCYITQGHSLKEICQKSSRLDFLIERDITKVYSTYNGEDPNANYGFSEKNKSWYGWSHRGCCHFEIGSQVKRGDVAYMPKSKEDFEQCMLEFWADEDALQMNIGNRTEEGFDVRWIYSSRIPNEKLRGKVAVEPCTYPEKYGRGEWEAKTLDDAKQMAMDYAENIG